MLISLSACSPISYQVTQPKGNRWGSFQHVWLKAHHPVHESAQEKENLLGLFVI